MHLPHIYLVGFMGTGKSYLGKRLALLLERDFLDLDDLIESHTSLSITELFAQKGETYFRQLESECLRQTIQRPPAVIACGGGTPCQHENMVWMNENGITIFLDTHPDLLLARLEKEFAHRPLLAQQSNLQAFILRKLAERRPVYEQAKISIPIHSNQRSVEREILDILFDDLDTTRH